MAMPSAVAKPVARAFRPKSVPAGQRVRTPQHRKSHKARPEVGKGKYVKAPLLRDKVVQPRWALNAAMNNPSNILAGGAIGAGTGILVGNRKDKVAKSDREKNAAAGALIGGGTGELGRVAAGYGAKATAERQFKPLTSRGNYGPYKEGPHKATLTAHKNKASKLHGSNVRAKAQYFDEHFPKGVPSYRARKVLTGLQKKPAVAAAVLGTAAVGAGVGATRKVKKNMTTSAFGVDHGVIAKYDSDPKDPKTKKTASTGRRVLASAPYSNVVHPFVAGKKGKKLRAGGNQIGGGMLGGLAGSTMGAAAGRGNPAISSAAGLAGGIAGSQMGLNRNQRKGYLKPE